MFPACNRGMAEYKKQHYVPQHFLRNFSDGNRTVAYNIENEKEYPPTPVANLCYENYFYDDDGEIEQVLSELEGTHASVLRKLTSNRNLNQLDRNEENNLLSFITLQSARTKADRIDQEEQMQALVTHIAKIDAEQGGEMTSEIVDKLKERKIRVKDDGMHTYSMLVAHSSIPLITDLNGVLIENKTETQFITSDRPIIKDNPKFKGKRERFLVGFQCPGLQIFCPLSPQSYLMLYDPNWYLLNSNKERRVSIQSKDQIDSLNKMQLIYANESVFYQQEQREEEIHQLLDEISYHRQNTMHTFNVLSPDEHNLDSENEIIESGHYVPSYSPDLPFVRNKAGDDARAVRNPDLYELHRMYVSEEL